MEYRDNLSKEVEILSFVYRNVIEIEKIDIEINGKVHIINIIHM